MVILMVIITFWEVNLLNREAVEELMDIRQLVFLNNGNGSRIDIDLSLVSDNVATSAEWSIQNSSSIGSDHFPIICALDVELDIQKS